jgi:hypothetical protein
MYLVPGINEIHYRAVVIMRITHTAQTIAITICQIKHSTLFSSR